MYPFCSFNFREMYYSIWYCVIVGQFMGVTDLLWTAEYQKKKKKKYYSSYKLWFYAVWTVAWLCRMRVDDDKR